MVRYELETPSFYRRLTAWLVDCGILVLLGTAITLWSFNVTAFNHESLLALQATPDDKDVGLAIAWVQVCYFGLFHSLMGRTPGKAMLFLRVVDANGYTPSFGQIFLRSILYPGLFIIPELALRYLSDYINPVVAVAGLALVILWAILDFIMTPIDFKAQRSLHDLLANTRVVVD